MKSSAQNKAGMNEKSVQAVSKQNFSKTDARYWQERIYKLIYTRDGKTCEVPEWSVKVQWRGRRELFNLQTSNKAAAAARAKDIYATIIGAGWDAAFEKFKLEMQRKAVSTVGDFLAELHCHWTGKPKTFEDYCQKFRTMLSQMFSIKGGSAKAHYDHVNGGRDAWIAKIDRIKLADVTPERVNKWRIAFVRQAGDNPVMQKRARISCNSIMRQAKSLFSPLLLAHLGRNKPEKSPFDGVKFYKRESMRYHSEIDFEALIQDAMRELPQEQLKIFLLATMAGLRKNEIDKLEWQAFRWNDVVIRIEASEHFTPKTEDSAGDVPIDKELLAMFRGWHAKASGSFVIESDTQPLIGLRWSHYRAHRHFDALTAWLRAKGVNAPKPLHELRKEFGSQLCAKYGIHAASRMLRHTDISLTAAHYTDQTRRVTIGVGNLLAMPKNIVPMQQDGESKPQTAKA